MSPLIMLVFRTFFVADTDLLIANTHDKYFPSFVSLNSISYSITMSDMTELLDALIQFRDARDWKQFHDTKNLAIALSIEAAELNELFLWKDVEQSEAVDKERIKEELADVFAYAFLLAEKHNLDVKEIVMEKIKRNGEKYPVDKAKGSAKKYTDL
jgi:NTP pyrophosphatase (non-canonical NTP hydrolase)